MNSQSNLKTIISILLVAIFVVLIFYINNLPETIQPYNPKPESSKITNQELQQDDSMASVVSPDYNSEQLFFENLAPITSINSPAIKPSKANAREEECDQELEALVKPIYYKLAYELTPEETEYAFLLTGFDTRLWLEKDNLSVEEYREGIQLKTRRRIELIKQQYKTDDTGLLSQLYLEQCAVNDYPDLCKPQELLAIADADPGNLRNWFLLLRYYRNQGNEAQVVEVFNRALSAQRFESNNSLYQREISRELISLTNSPTFVMWHFLPSRRDNIYGLGDFIKYCDNQITDGCYRIGELLEQQGDSIMSLRLGFDMQIRYLINTDQVALADEKTAQKKLFTERWEKLLTARTRLPANDLIANYMIEMLDIENEYDYLKAISNEAERLLTENPDLCAW
jgi:hypothetical protein